MRDMRHVGWAMLLIGLAAGGGACAQDDADPTVADAGGDGDGDGDCDGLSCTDPPGPCFASSGTCADGGCEYTPVLAGEACEAPGCSGTGHCDAQGNCIAAGTDDDCTREHAYGACVDGACGDWTCDDGWGNCDEDWANGCEIPVGMPHQCSAQGIDPNGCWTAHCGTLDDPAAMNFDTYYCYDCSTCRGVGEGQCQWCNHETGTWFELEACECGMYEDVACLP